MVEKDVPYKVLCLLRDEFKMTVVSNLYEKKLNNLARLTQTVAANGVTEIDKRFLLGKSEQFRV